MSSISLERYGHSGGAEALGRARAEAQAAAYTAQRQWRDGWCDGALAAADRIAKQGLAPARYELHALELQTRQFRYADPWYCGYAAGARALIERRGGWS